VNLTLKIRLPGDRKKTGTLTVIDPLTGLALYGPVPVLGRAARDTAKANGNPSGSPLLKYGDTPTGTYRIANILANGDGTTRPVEKYGQSGSIVLDPQTGDAKTAKDNGRTGLFIHSGRHAFSSVVGPQSLKPTNGCVRMLDWHMAQLIDVIRTQTLAFPGDVVVEVGEPGGPMGDIDESVLDVDPPPSGGGVLLP
jgi:L,D-transpeptidase catalytic domain